MARYKAYDLKQTKMIALSYADQLVEGSFEHALNELVENHLDLRPFEARYANDETGRPAYDPRLLLKVVLYGYYKGVLSSRAVAVKDRLNGPRLDRPNGSGDRDRQGQQVAAVPVASLGSAKRIA